MSGTFMFCAVPSLSREVVCERLTAAGIPWTIQTLPKLQRDSECFSVPWQILVGNVGEEIWLWIASISAEPGSPEDVELRRVIGDYRSWYVQATSRAVLPRLCLAVLDDRAVVVLLEPEGTLLGPEFCSIMREDEAAACDLVVPELPSP